MQILHGMDTQSPGKPICVPDNLLMKGELARRMQVSERKIELMMNKGEIPFIKIGTSVRFNWERVLVALENNEAA
jgi:excisionase family DNA binding protein